MKNYLLNNDRIVELLSDNKLVIIDGGARGEIFKPMSLINKSIIQVIRFEPDADASIVNNGNDIIISKALWNQQQSIDINIAKEPSTSSVYPFNEALQRYIDPIKDSRKTTKIVSVDAISIDECLEKYSIKGIDFIKLDIHGAEYEALEGAAKALKNTLGLLVESWIVPVHIGQKTRGDIERLALNNGFYVFEENVVAKWGRKIDKFQKRQPIAVDTLFFKDILLNDAITDKVKIIKLIGLADLFEHYGFAWQLTMYAVDKKIIDVNLEKLIMNHLNHQNRMTFKNKIYAKLNRMVNQLNDCAFK
jgi:FkbM family methyltransferase